MARIAALLFLLTLLGISEATALADSWSSANKTGNDGSVTSTAKDEGENLRLKAPKPKVKSQLIKEAPEVDLENGDGDIDKDGKCMKSIKKFCEGIEEGESRLADCIFKELKAEKKGDSEEEVPKECIQEVKGFMRKRSANINEDTVLAKACKADAEKLCKGLTNPSEVGQVITCLADNKQKLAPPCKKVLQKREMDASESVDADAPLLEACKDDISAVCDPENEDVRQCLVDNRARISWSCQVRLGKEDIERSDDWRLSAKLFQACYNDKMMFCKEIEAGGSRVKDCLEENREQPDFSSNCKDEIDKMIQARSSNFLLDYDLKTGCKVDIEKLCNYEADIVKDLLTDDASVINCLQDFRDELVTESCKKQVHKTIEREATDIRFNAQLLNACVDDRANFCKDIPAGNARVIRCLQDNRASLSFSCRSILFDQEVMMAESIDFQVPLKKACGEELKRHCKDVDHSHALAIECLADHEDDDTTTEECKNEIKRYEIKSSEDYRLNYRLQRACELDVETLCANVCDKMSYDVCGGKIYQCLSDNSEKVQNKACSNELFRFQEQETKDYRMDKPLVEKCAADVEKFCSKVNKGDNLGSIHECLYDHLTELSDDCRQQEEKIQQLEAKDVRLQPGVMAACNEEIALVCKGVQPGQGRIIDCLIANIDSGNYSPKCAQRTKKVLEKQEKDFSLSYQLSTSCKQNADDLCADKQGKGHREAAVLKCLVDNADSLDENCSGQVSKLLRNALWTYRQGAILTSACDPDANKCREQLKKPGQLGRIGMCLTQQVLTGKSIESPCKKLVLLAAPSETKAAFEDNLTKTDIMEKLATLQKATLEMASGGLKITGWIAFVAIGALVILLLASAYFIYQRYYGKNRQYTVVTKQGDI